jgi:Flp pilus assembly protein TadD
MILLRLALDLRPDFTPARVLAAELLESGRHLDNALQMLAAVGNDDPLIAVIRLQRAALAERLGNTEDAMRDLQRIARDYPSSPLPAMREGDILRSKQRFTDAIAAYDRAIARIGEPAPSDWLVFYDRGICYERSRQWAKAEADFQRALKLAPDQPFVLNYLGYSWADMGQNLVQARAMIEKAVQRRPNDGAITDSLGWVMLRQGEVTEAVKVLEHAVELDPEDPSINGHLGDAYWAAGRKLEATYQWRRALTFNPEPDDAAKLEAKLQGDGRQSAVVSGQ